MANIMTKQGSLDNVVTYEHICDTSNDMKKINPQYITLGSTCIVISGESGGMEVYIANSDKEWESISISGGADGGNSSLSIQILGTNEYNENGVPTISTPIENVIYLVPSDDEYSNDIFKEWIYISNDWEQIGGVHIRIPTPDWNVENYGESGYINNKPPIKKGTANWSIAEGRDTVASSIAAHAEGSSSVASGTNSHAEGVDTTASGASAHAEGRHTIAASNYQHVFGEYNIADNNATYIEIVGNGNSDIRSNARTLDWNGNEWLAGDLTLNQTILTENNLIQLLALRTTEVNIPDTDVIINANSNTRYICGEVSTLDFTPSATGICNVRFTSGSSKTILTLPSTVKMPDWFEVEANMIYEISIADGIYGVVTSWAV